MVILNHREALFYDIVTICFGSDSTVEQRFCRHCYDGCWFGSCSRAKANPHYRKKIWDSSSLDPTKIDPDLIGGFVVTANHKTLDTSLKHQLQVIKSKLK